jgi:hypothetical protein
MEDLGEVEHREGLPRVVQGGAAPQWRRGPRRVVQAPRDGELQRGAPRVLQGRTRTDW